jgi:hypothetical protein
MEAACVAAMCAFRHDLYMDQWMKVFGQPPADATGLNQDPATGGSHHEQLQAQKARGSESFKLGEYGKLAIKRQSDGKLVVADNKVSCINKKGEVVAELPVTESAAQFAEEYVRGGDPDKDHPQAQMDNQVAGREGGLAPWPAVLSCGRWGLNIGKPYVPGAIAKSLGLRAGTDGTIKTRFEQEHGFRAFPRYHGE